MEEWSTGKYNMIKQLKLKDITAMVKFAHKENTFVNKKYFEDIMDNKKSITLGYFNNKNEIIGLTSATAINNNAYGSFLHCKTSLSPCRQMIVLVKLLDGLELILMQKVDKLFMAASNLYDQLIRRGYKLYREEGNLKTFVKELK